MTPKEARRKFEEQLAALEVVVMYIERSISLLRRSVEGEVALVEGKKCLERKQDTDMMRISLTHYVVNNFVALFDDRDRNKNSLKNIANRFKRHFPNNFFVEYLTSVGEFEAKHSGDLERMEKNRHLSTAHLGASDRERLGYSRDVAKEWDKILGTQSQSPVAENDALRFITPFNLFRMFIINDIAQLKIILGDLVLKEHLPNKFYVSHRRK